MFVCKYLCLLREQAGVNCKHLKLVELDGADIVYLSLNDCWPVASVSIKVSQYCSHGGDER